MIIGLGADTELTPSGSGVSTPPPQPPPTAASFLASRPEATFADGLKYVWAVGECSADSGSFFGFGPLFSPLNSVRALANGFRTGQAETGGCGVLRSSTAYYLGAATPLIAVGAALYFLFSGKG